MKRILLLEAVLQHLAFGVSGSNDRNTGSPTFDNGECQVDSSRRAKESSERQLLHFFKKIEFGAKTCGWKTLRLFVKHNFARQHSGICKYINIYTLSLSINKYIYI